MGTMNSAGQRIDPNGRFSHMAELDAVVWRKYLEDFGSDIDRVWYDVWVGDCEGKTKGLLGADLARVKGMYSKRIDAVTSRAGLYELWEIKPYGNSVALGQAIMYRKLFEDSYPDLKPVRGVILCGTADGDCTPIMDQHGIVCICIQNAFSHLANGAG